MLRLPAAALAVLFVLPSTLPADDVPQLGSLDFPNSGAAEAQEAFVRGVLLLHSFEYEDAREAFREARTIDPGFALAAWGEAMTHNHPLWRGLDLDAARAALDELGPTLEDRLATAATKRERGYLQAVDTLFFGPGDKVERDQAYEHEMARLSAAHPDDLEAKAFWSLSILGTAQGVRDFATYMRAGATAEEVFAANPRHPGAAHYLIHSYDDPIHAPLGVRAARVYAEIAPAASHAQHMISHIHVALGRWEESIESNVTSWDVSVERAERKELGVDARNFHALQWLQYSLLQLGRVDEAAEKLTRMRTMAAESQTPRALWYFAAMRASQAVESSGDVPPALGADGAPAAAVLEAFTEGWLAGEPERRLAAAARIRETIEASRVDEGEAQLTSGYGALNEEQRRAAEVMALELEALALESECECRRDEAIATLTEAAELEADRALEYGPPAIVKPSHELLGEMLLRADRPADAAARFEEALERAPRRLQALRGLEEASSDAPGAVEGRESVAGENEAVGCAAH